MNTENTRDGEGIRKGTLFKGLLGILPVPIVGEVGMSMFFYDILRETPLKNISIPAAPITRLQLYAHVYASMLDYFN